MGYYNPESPILGDSGEENRMTITSTRIYGDDGRVRARVQVGSDADAIEIVTAGDAAMDAVLYAIEIGVAVIRRTTITGGKANGVDAVCAYLDDQPDIRAIGLSAKSATDRLVAALVHAAVATHANALMVKKMESPTFFADDILELVAESAMEEEE